MNTTIPFPLLAGGAGLLALLSLSLTSPPAHAPGFQPSIRRVRTMDMASRVVDYVARGESGGKYSAQNRNTDGQGLSYGLLQWAQRPGSLGILLAKMQKRDSAAFARIFGGSAGALVKATNAGTAEERLAPVGGVVLWAEPWTARFAGAGKYAPFQEVQRELAKTGFIFQTSLRVVELLGVRTERAYVLAYDRSNHAPSIAKSLAEEQVEAYNGGGWPVEGRTILTEYAARWANRYLSRAKPSKGDWRLVGGSYHRFTGSADLYEIVVRRTAEILGDPTLSDAPIVLTA